MKKKQEMKKRKKNKNGGKCTQRKENKKKKNNKRVKEFLGRRSKSERRYLAYLIFVIFSPRIQFLAQFFSTQKHVNRDKADFATKQRKSQNKLILPQKQHKM